MRNMQQSTGWYIAAVIWFAVAIIELVSDGGFTIPAAGLGVVMIVLGIQASKKKKIS